jgi:predicted AAA+ superfamily ATPase
MSRIRPFIGSELIKVLTGIRRSGKSVMLELIQSELIEQGVSPSQFVSINFENMNNAHLCTAEALHKDMTSRIAGIAGKSYLFFDEIQEVDGWEKCVNSFRVEFDCDIYITATHDNIHHFPLISLFGVFLEEL